MLLFLLVPLPFEVLVHACDRLETSCEEADDPVATCVAV
jgi:hypothetical protein